ncbi:MAG: helix-turn-helix domain-containing protein [Methylophaga sp.]|nr:helix-turn-helix domain-containing protein [Methylophaga sp.]
MNKLSLNKRRDKRQLLVENKLSFAGPDSELSIYDTYRAASRVGLGADQLMYCGMVKGKKIMHNFHDEQEQVFLPHESFVMPPGEYVEIDFPEANEQQPTTCLTIEIPKERIETISEKMSDLTSLNHLDHDWQYQPHIIHSQHTADTQQLLEKLVLLFTHNHPDKEILVELGVSELIIKLLRQQGRDLLLNYSQQSPDATGITAVINYIEQNSAEPLDIETLCQKACMSKSKLYIVFKKQLGCSPSEYLQQKRLKKSAEALDLGRTVTQACYDSGFNDLSHFSRRFTQFFGCSPRQYRTKHSVESTSN